MYQHILLAVALQKWEQFSPHALAAREAAAALAKGSGAKLSVLSVYDYELSVYDYDQIEEPSLPQEMAARYRDNEMLHIDSMMETKMKTFIGGMHGMDIPITPLLRAGEPRKTIIATAQTLQPDLLVIGAHSKRSVFAVVLGGTAAYVSRHASCPVVMVKPGEKHPPPATA